MDSVQNWYSCQVKGTCCMYDSVTPRCGETVVWISYRDHRYPVSGTRCLASVSREQIALSITRTISVWPSPHRGIDGYSTVGEEPP